MINQLTVIVHLSPIDGKNNIRSEMGVLQKELYRWKSSSAYWGPRVWYYLHYTAAYYIRTREGYTPNQINGLYEWLHGIPLIIPCRKCKYWYSKYVLRTPNLRDICVDSKLFFDFIIDIHNRVNKKMGKNIVEREIVYNYFNIIIV